MVVLTASLGVPLLYPPPLPLSDPVLFQNSAEREPVSLQG